MSRVFIHDEAIGKRHPCAGDRGGAGSTVRLNDIAVDGDLALAERLQVDDRAQRAADQALNFHGAAALLAGSSLAAGAVPVARGNMPYSAVTPAAPDP